MALGSAYEKNQKKKDRIEELTYKGSIIHERQSSQSNKSNLKHIIPAIQVCIIYVSADASN